MVRIFDIEHWRLVFISVFSSVAGYFSPTSGFLVALMATFVFNVWAGMRADGVSISRCRNFSFSKFKNALAELLLYLALLELVFIVTERAGDIKEGIFVIKSLAYVFMYVYIQNALRNLITAYPRTMALRIVYHVIRLEFARALPSHLGPIIERIDEEYKRQENEQSDAENNPDT